MVGPASESGLSAAVNITSRHDISTQHVEFDVLGLTHKAFEPANIATCSSIFFSSLSVFFCFFVLFSGRCFFPRPSATLASRNRR